MYIVKLPTDFKAPPARQQGLRNSTGPALARTYKQLNERIVEKDYRLTLPVQGVTCEAEATQLGPSSGQLLRGTRLPQFGRLPATHREPAHRKLCPPGS